MRLSEWNDSSYLLSLNYTLQDNKGKQGENQRDMTYVLSCELGGGQYIVKTCQILIYKSDLSVVVDYGLQMQGVERTTESKAIKRD